MTEKDPFAALGGLLVGFMVGMILMKALLVLLAK